MQTSGKAWFCAGTRIMTLRGEVPIEDVRTSDRVVTLSGNGSTLKPVAALDRITIDLDSHPAPHTAAPIRVHAGAFEPGMPVRDLLLAPDHALSMEDDDGLRVLVPALYLLNGATVTREPARDTVHYFNVALEAHDVLMADGMAAESAVDVPAEAESGTVVSLRPAARAAPPPPDLTPHLRDGLCGRLLLGADSIPIHSRLIDAAEEAGYSFTTDPDLRVVVDGEEVAPLAVTGGEYVYLLPPNTSAIELHSRSRVPGEIDPKTGDPRRLGVALARLLYDGTELPMDSAAFAEGFLPAEGDGAASWRWTTGLGTVCLPPLDIEATLELHIHTDWSRYWLAPVPETTAP